MNDIGEFLAAGVVFALFISVVFGLAGLFTFVLWNWLMPAIFGLPQITFWESIGLWLLSGVLFSGDRAIKYSKE